VKILRKIFNVSNAQSCAVLRRHKPTARGTAT
jgi:hypothetical protein